MLNFTSEYSTKSVVQTHCSPAQKNFGSTSKQQKQNNNSNDKQMSNQIFMQQMASLKDKYSSISQPDKNKQEQVKNGQQEHFLTLYEKYMQKQQSSQNRTNSNSTSLNQKTPPFTKAAKTSANRQNQQTFQSPSMHQLNANNKVAGKIIQNLNPSQPIINLGGLHRLSLDNFGSSAFKSQEFSLTASQQCKKLNTNTSGLSGNGKAIKNTISPTNEIECKKPRNKVINLNEKKNHHFNTKEQGGPTQLMSSYYASTKGERSRNNEDNTTNANKYLSFGGRSQTADQIDIKEQLTGRDSNLLSQYEEDDNILSKALSNNKPISRYETTLQNIVYRNDQQSEETIARMSNLQNALTKSLGQRPKNTSITNLLQTNLSPLSHDHTYYSIRNSGDMFNNHQIILNDLQQGISLNKIQQNNKDLLKQLQIQASGLQQSTLSQPSSTKNVESPFLQAKHFQTTKPLNFEPRSDQQYFQFPDQQNHNKKVDMPEEKYIDENGLKKLFVRVQAQLNGYRKRESKLTQQNIDLQERLADVTQRYQKAQLEIERLQFVPEQRSDASFQFNDDMD